MDTEILDLLEQIGRTSVARLSPSVTLKGETAKARRDQVLATIRGTVLPRRLEFTAANGDCLAIEVNSSRITDVFRVRSGIAPDFATDSRDTLAQQLAQLVSDIALAPAPLELVSLQPDTALEADDVGITLSEVSKACETIELQTTPVVSIVTDQPDPAPVQAMEPAENGVAAQFYQGSDRFALGRLLCASQDGSTLHAAGDCTAEGQLHPTSDVLDQFARDLAGWDGDVSAQPGQAQLIVLRPSGGKGTALAVVYDGAEISITIHEARKLGAVVNLWTALTDPKA